MGIASYDITGDGLPEGFLTRQAKATTSSRRSPTEPPNRGLPRHRETSGRDRAATLRRRRRAAVHGVARRVPGREQRRLRSTSSSPKATSRRCRTSPRRTRESNLMLGNANETVTESGEAAGIVSFTRGRGAAVVDLNLDGMLDLVEVNRRASMSSNNVGGGDATQPVPMGDWVSVRLEQPGPNRDAIGSWRGPDRRSDDRAGGDDGGGHASGDSAGSISVWAAPMPPRSALVGRTARWGRGSSAGGRSRRSSAERRHR